MREDAIRNWFAKEWGGSLMLPDGWFGRPYDNQHELTACEDSPSRLSIGLDNHLNLIFIGNAKVTVEGRNLVISSFEKLLFDAQPYGEGSTHTKEYNGGVVRLVVAPGS